MFLYPHKEPHMSELVVTVKYRSNTEENEDIVVFLRSDRKINVEILLPFHIIFRLSLLAR